VNLGRTKSIEQSIADTEEPAHQLRKRLGPVELTLFGIGVIVGTGIFVLTGKAAGVQAGPAVALSFVFAGIACALAGLCYAEFASTVPVAGSAYTFSYASLGEFVAWIIGWDLVLELALGASTVAVGWSSYFADVMKSAGVTIPHWAYGGSHNVVAAAIVLILTAVICLGIKISSQVNMVIVAVKVGIVLFVIVAVRLPGSRGCPKHAVAAAGSRRFPRFVRHHWYLHRRRTGVLRIHRLRHRGNRRGGDQETAAGYAHRHPRLPGHLHCAVRRRVARDRRDGEIHRHQDQCAAG
jgi:amino acid permease